jgi:hypothetical protein
VEGRSPTDQSEPIAAWPVVALVASLGLALAGLAAAAVDGPPYLDLGSLNPWVVLFAAGLFGALLAVPFATNRLLAAARPARAESWEPAMLIWGAVAVIALLVGAGLIAAGGFSPGRSLADAVGLLLVIEAGMVAGTLLAWLLNS